MSKKNDGGPAFPTTDSNKPHEYGTYGLSLRDYFAAKAMQGLLTDDRSLDLNFREIAADSYRLADAMLMERKK